MDGAAFCLRFNGDDGENGAANIILPSLSSPALPFFTDRLIVHSTPSSSKEVVMMGIRRSLSKRFFTSSVFCSPLRTQ